ncbi:MAG: DUF4838 domain-containing protein [Planctomycetota bacterium]|jgi:hypothetical protein
MNRLFIQSALIVLSICNSSIAQQFIIKDTKPNAQIITVKDPDGSVKLAAEELQRCLRKITGAELPLVNTVDENIKIKIYVGKSKYTDDLKIDTTNLKHGAYIVRSGKYWLALIGGDKRFNPTGMLGMTTLSRSSPEKKKLYENWLKMTNSKWGLPFGQIYKKVYKHWKISEFDESGTFNAVSDYLRSLGMRWYSKGEIGEVALELKDIKLPQIDKTVKPDFPVRHPYIMGLRFSQGNKDAILWHLRLGLNLAPDLVGPGHIGHGIIKVYGDPSFKKNHPEYFAMKNGKRDLHHKKHGSACYSSKGLIDENIRYARAIFDNFDVDVISVMPGDGLNSICQCDLCKGKNDPEEGWYGHLSNWVWDYVNKVGTELYKTHPEKKIICFAYTSYFKPPTRIKKLSPNILVGMCQLTRAMDDPDRLKIIQDSRRGWLERLPKGEKQLVIYDYYLEEWRKQFKGMPAYYPNMVDKDIKSLKGISKGFFIETRADAPMVLNLYVASRLWWDADQDAKKLLDEYYTKYFGPAAAEMKAFTEYSEKTWKTAAKNVEQIDKILELMKKAEIKAPVGSIYAKRIAIMANYIKPLSDLKLQFSMKRENVPLVRFIRRKKDTMTIDGKVDDKLWGKYLNDKPGILAGQSSGKLKDIFTGKDVKNRTEFQIAAIDNNIVFGIKCYDNDMKNIKIGSTVNEDPGIWAGDNIELLLETQSHSYYQITICPSGAYVDVDRDGGIKMNWSSGADIKTHIADDHWSIEISLPLSGEMQALVDPSNGIAGKTPTSTYPWHFNICRQRVRGDITEFSAFSPTGKKNFHDIMKFAKLHRKGL